MDSKEGLGGEGFVVLRGKSSRESKNACREEGGVEKMSSTRSKFMVRGDECFEGILSLLAFLEGDGLGDAWNFMSIYRARLGRVNELSSILEVMSDFYMFGTRMENEVFTKVDGTFIVTKNG
nr:hypothetical protein [Tanacetum cinerariifolium]